MKEIELSQLANPGLFAYAQALVLEYLKVLLDGWL